jgi:peptidyl-prolyl cis-trans isomerase A (cyclophilin A)
MKKLFLILLSIINFFPIFSQGTVDCVIKTSLGDIQIELYQEQAPITVSNFLRYVDSSTFDNSNFYRVCTKENEANRDIKIEVIQGADIAEEKSFEAIELETTEKTKILHKHGTISMARDTPNSATTSFFICINNQPELDFGGKRNPDGQGFAAFGKVTAGMDIVIEIQNGKNKDQLLLLPIEILSIRRINE